MSWKQVKDFDIKKMGSKAGYCLQNTRLGFGVNKALYPSAKAEMEAQKKTGTLHDISTIPYNCAVPVFVDSASPYEHVMVYDEGLIFSDGKNVNASLNDFKCFGWGETIAGVRVVKKTTAQNNRMLPERGYWLEGDYDTRVARIAAFMRMNFPAYTAPQAISNTYNSYLVASVKEFQKRVGIKVDGSVGENTLAKLGEYGFKPY